MAAAQIPTHRYLNIRNIKDGGSKVALAGYETTAKDLIIEAAKEAGLVEEVARFLSLANLEVTRDLAHEALLKHLTGSQHHAVARSCSTTGIILQMRPAA